jgi:hypothetical protein
MAAVLTNATMIAFVGTQFTDGAPRARPCCTAAHPLYRPDSPADSAPLCLNRRCDRAPGESLADKQAALMGINERFSRAKLWAIAVAIEHGVLPGTNPILTLEKELLDMIGNLA